MAVIHAPAATFAPQQSPLNIPSKTKFGESHGLRKVYKNRYTGLLSVMQLAKCVPSCSAHLLMNADKLNAPSEARDNDVLVCKT